MEKGDDGIDDCYMPQNIECVKPHLGCHCQWKVEDMNRGIQLWFYTGFIYARNHRRLEYPSQINKFIQNVEITELCKTLNI